MAISRSGAGPALPGRSPPAARPYSAGGLAHSTWLRDNLGGHSLSPDGQWIAVVRSRKTIALIPSGSGAVRDLSPGAKTPPGFNGLAWTPDSRAVVVKTGSGRDGELWLVPIDGGPGRTLVVDVRQIAPPAFTGLALHSDGRRLAFVSGNTGKEIWVLENFLSVLRD